MSEDKPVCPDKKMFSKAQTFHNGFGLWLCPEFCPLQPRADSGGRPDSPTGTKIITGELDRLIKNILRLVAAVAASFSKMAFKVSLRSSKSLPKYISSSASIDLQSYVLITSFFLYYCHIGKTY
jgi:hypothetical protein